MDNLRRLTAAWCLYADDSDGKFPGNYHGGFVPGVAASQRPWATGWLDWTTSPDNTNTLYLTEARYAALGPLLGPGVTWFKCPADTYLAVGQVARGWTARVRSYALNCAVGEGNAETGPLNSTVAHLRKRSDFSKLSPQRTFVFIEEHPDSINDPLFFVPNAANNLPDVPGSLHDGACWVSFADGHLELRPWESVELKRPVRLRNANNLPVSPGNPDLEWLLEHTPRR